MPDENLSFEQLAARARAALESPPAHDLAGRPLVNYDKALKARAAAWQAIRAAIKVAPKAPVWIGPARLSIRTYVDRKHAVRLMFYRSKAARSLEVTCLPYEAAQVGLWAYVHICAAAGLLPDVTLPPPPVPMSKELAKHGRACRYVWTLAALEACGLKDTGGYEGAQVLGAYGGGAP